MAGGAALGLLGFYILHAARHWSAGRRWTGVLLLVFPVLVALLVGIRFAGPGHAAVALGLSTLTGMVAAAFVCILLARFIGRSRRPNRTVALAALLLLSSAVIAGASPSYLDQNFSMLSHAAVVAWPGAPSLAAATPGEATAVPTLQATAPQPTGTGLEGVPVTRTFGYTLRGQSGAFTLTLHGGVDAALDRRRPAFHGDYGPYYGGFVDEAAGAQAVEALAGAIRTASATPDDGARRAIALVQAIPYDHAALANGTARTRYPYQTLYDQTGVCGEKSLLLAALLRELGYGVALLRFGPENHMTVGVRCPPAYAYRGTGYAFIESTQPSITTDAVGEYVGTGRLVSTPEVIAIAEGRSFGSIGEEVADAAEYRALVAAGPVLDPYHYARWQALVKSYGIRTAA